MKNNTYKIEQKQEIKRPVYIQSNTRKSYPNRFLVEVIEKVKKYKKPTESVRGFIEDAIIEKLNKIGCEFNKPLTEEEQRFWLEDAKNL